MNLETAQQILVLYRDKKEPTGDFLQAVLENNLEKSLRNADPESFKIIPEIIKYLWWEFPAPIWGSPEKVQNHLKVPHNATG